jgi:transcriptional regulator with XRE-family HTH domain
LGEARVCQGSGKRGAPRLLTVSDAVFCELGPGDLGEDLYDVKLYKYSTFLPVEVLTSTKEFCKIMRRRKSDEEVKTMKLPRLKELREKRGLSQEALSELADVSRDSISSYERGVREAHPGTATKLAEALEVEVKNLVDTGKVEVEVRWEDSDGFYRAEKLRFTGELVDSYEYNAYGGTDRFELYECPDGYRIYYDRIGDDEPSELLPNWVNNVTGELDYGFYTAEEVVREHPQFGTTVGVLRVRDLD